jgi:hypothetical protein
MDCGRIRAAADLTFRTSTRKPRRRSLGYFDRPRRVGNSVLGMQPAPRRYATVIALKCRLAGSYSGFIASRPHRERREIV